MELQTRPVLDMTGRVGSGLVGGIACQLPTAIRVCLFEETRELIPFTEEPYGNNSGTDLLS